MNLTKNPTPEQLAEIIAACDKDSGNHVLWVDHDGNVSIENIGNATPAPWSGKEKHKYKFMWEMIPQGSSYLGYQAATDKEQVDYLFNRLIDHWRSGMTGVISG